MSAIEEQIGILRESFTKKLQEFQGLIVRITLIFTQDNSTSEKEQKIIDYALLSTLYLLADKIFDKIVGSDSSENRDITEICIYKYSKLVSVNIKFKPENDNEIDLIVISASSKCLEELNKATYKELSEETQQKINPDNLRSVVNLDVLGVDNPLSEDSPMNILARKIKSMLSIQHNKDITEILTLEDPQYEIQFMDISNSTKHFVIEIITPES
jgi:hypothetical protein